MMDHEHRLYKYLSWLLFVSMVIAGSRTSCIALPPLPAKEAGYMLNTFSTVFNDKSVDLSNMRQAGFSWYFWSFFGKNAQAQNIVLNDDNTITLLGDSTGPNGQIATIALNKTDNRFTGHAFGGGGYFEAVLKFDPSAVLSSMAKGWPSFWAMSSEHLSQSGEQWIGRPEGYNHFIEVDIFEYDVVKKGKPLNFYGVNLHDWYGTYNKSGLGMPYSRSSLPYAQVKIQVPEMTRFSDYHRYGFLWIPAKIGVMGIGRFFFDRKQVGQDIEWEMISGQSGVPDHQPWKFGVIDKQHLVLLLGTGPNQPMTVRSVNVWQKSDELNLLYN